MQYYARPQPNILLRTKVYKRRFKSGDIRYSKATDADITTRSMHCRVCITLIVVSHQVIIVLIVVCALNYQQLSLGVETMLALKTIRLASV